MFFSIYDFLYTSIFAERKAYYTCWLLTSYWIYFIRLNRPIFRKKSWKCWMNSTRKRLKRQKAVKTLKKGVNFAIHMVKLMRLKWFNPTKYLKKNGRPFSNGNRSALQQRTREKDKIHNKRNGENKIQKQKGGYWIVFVSVCLSVCL